MFAEWLSVQGQRKAVERSFQSWGYFKLTQVKPWWCHLMWGYACLEQGLGEQTGGGPSEQRYHVPGGHWSSHLYSTICKNLLEAKNRVLKPNSHQDPYDSPITGQALLLSSPTSSYTISISTGPWH